MIIELTRPHINQHLPLWVNSDYILWMDINKCKDETVTMVFCKDRDSCFEVLETPDEIMELIKTA